MIRGNLLYDIGTLLYLLGILAGAAFTITYGVTAPWWRSAIGRMFMVIGCAILFAGVTVLYQIAVATAAGVPLRAYALGDLILRLSGYALFSLAMGFLLGTYLHERRKPLSLLPIRKEHSMSKHIALVQSDEIPAAPGTPTQVANPTRATIRTIVQNLVILLPLVNIVAAGIIDYLNTQTSLAIPGWAFAVLNGVVAVTAFVIGLVARIMATPGVNEWIKAHLPFLAPIPVTKSID